MPKPLLLSRHITAEKSLEVPMSSKIRPVFPLHTAHQLFKRLKPTSLIVFALCLLPLAAYAQTGSPFDTGFTNMQNLFTGTVAKVASLIAIVIGGYGFAHGEPGAKKALAGVAAGTGIAVLAVNVLSWLWGV
jgi:type IV secretory pathway VirB2 component (pilin)